MALTDSHSDKELLAYLRQGETEAFVLIYRRYVRPLFYAADKRLQDSALAEDMVQDVFLRLWERRATLDIDDLGAYLHTAIRYRVLNHIARKKDPAAFFVHFEQALTDFSTPEHQLVAKQLLDLVYAYAATLPEKRRQVFLLHIRDKLSPAQIAAELDISVKTAYNHLGSAMKGLHTHIIPVLLAFWKIF